MDMLAQRIMEMELPRGMEEDSGDDQWFSVDGH